MLIAAAASAAPAAVKERVKVSLPDPGQLSAARLQFKVRGDKSPKLKLKLKNARDLPGELIGAAQMTRSTKEKGRAVALVSFANVPSATPRRAPRVIAEKGLIEVSSTGTGTNVSDIELQNVPRSRNFASVLGLEPGQERQQAQRTFGISDSEVPDDDFGRIDLSEVFEIVDLKKVEETKIITSRSTLQDDLQDLYRQWGTASAIAAAIGPPAVLDAELYGLVTGQPPPFVFQRSFGPSPGNPSFYFVRVDFTLPVMGAQLSQASDIDLLDGPEARCQNGFFNDGLVTRGKGPLVSVGLSYRLDCDLPQDSPTVFYDVPLESPPPQGIDVFLFMPFAYYGSDEIGEAVGGEETTVMVRSP